MNIVVKKVKRDCYFQKGLKVRKQAPLVHTCTKKLRHLALVRRLFLHKYMSHRNAINLMAFNDIGGSKAKNLCHCVKVVERFPYILSNSNENIQILKIFFSCSFDKFSCKVDSKEGFIMP